MFLVRHRSAVINWRFCLTRPAFRPRACKRLPANSISAKRLSSCRRRATINRAAWTATLARAWSPHIFFFAGNLRDGGKVYARMWAPALGIEEDSATGAACAGLVGATASKPDFCGDDLSPF